MIKIGETAAKVYVGDMQPVNIYKGATKIAGWHPQTVSGTGTISLDGVYNVPPDALVIDGKCQQTVGVWGTNLVTNGDFSNGTTGWGYIASTPRASSGSNPFTATAKNGYTATSGLAYTANHKWYARALVKADSNLVNLNFGGAGFTGNAHSGGGLWETISGIFTYGSNATTYFRCSDGRSAGWTEIEIDDALVIDLTATFGTGNEPTATQMDAYLAAYPNSWFDGSALLTTSGTPNSPSPTYPAPITTIAGDLTITAANGDLSDTVVTPLGSVELCSLPDGTEDEYDCVTGVLTKWVGKYVGASGTSWEITDAATNASFISDKIAAGNLLGQTLTSPSACAPTVYYELATPYTIQLTPDLPVVRTGIKTLTVSANITPSFTATVKAMDD